MCIRVYVYMMSPYKKKSNTQRPLASLVGLTYLHHQHHRVEGDHGHNEVLKGWRDHERPRLILERLLVLGLVSCQGFGADGKVNASPLQAEKGIP